MQCKVCMKVMNTANIMNNKLQAMVQLLINTQTKTEAIVILNTGKKNLLTQNSPT